jgi:hypothetical protein
MCRGPQSRSGLPKPIVGKSRRSRLRSTQKNELFIYCSLCISLNMGDVISPILRHSASPLAPRYHLPVGSSNVTRAGTYVYAGSLRLLDLRASSPGRQFQGNACQRIRASCPLVLQTASGRQLQGNLSCVSRSQYCSDPLELFVGSPKSKSLALYTGNITLLLV